MGPSSSRHTGRTRRPRRGGNGWRNWKRRRPRGPHERPFREPKKRGPPPWRLVAVRASPVTSPHLLQHKAFPFAPTCHTAARLRCLTMNPGFTGVDSSFLVVGGPLPEASGYSLAGENNALSASAPWAYRSYGVLAARRTKCNRHTPAQCVPSDDKFAVLTAPACQLKSLGRIISRDEPHALPTGDHKDVQVPILLSTSCNKRAVRSLRTQKTEIQRFVAVLG